MKTVYKYDITEEKNISFPKGAEILSVGIQYDRVKAWALVDTEETEVEFRYFEIVATGQAVTQPRSSFLGTVFAFNLVFHVFEWK